ncbi:MAG TPA: hypothetical protein VIY29_26755 [Ktedonobacteraceae bacterium]
MPWQLEPTVLCGILLLYIRCDESGLSHDSGFRSFLLLVSRSCNWLSDGMYHVLLIAAGGMPGIEERKQG